MKTQSETKLDLESLVHRAEILWIVVWVLLGIVALLGTNLTFELAKGERNLWQIVFGFLL